MADGNIKDILYETVADDFESMLELDQGSVGPPRDTRPARQQGRPRSAPLACTARPTGRGDAPADRPPPKDATRARRWSPGNRNLQAVSRVGW